MPVSFEQLLQIGQVVVVACSAAVTLYVFLRARNDKRWEAQHERVDRLDSRMPAVEATLRHMPTHNDMDRLRQDISRLDERSATTLSSVRRIESYLLESKP